MKQSRVLHSVGLILWLVFATTSHAWAQNTASTRASAQALFDEGKQLLSAGQAAAACPKLEESLKLDPAIGTRYQLAKCYEVTGRTASAWTLYLEVAAAARTASQNDRETFARQQAQKLEPALSYLTILVPVEAREQGLRVTRNGVALGRGSWNARLPVDPGRYTIVVEAPGKRSWQGRVDVAGPKGDEQVAVPTLQAAASAPSAPSMPGATDQNGAGSAEEPSRALTPKHWVGIGLAGAGVVSLGLGGAFALRAKGLDDESGCKNGNCPTEEALADNHDARQAGELATIFGVAGGVLVLGGAAVFFAPIGSTSETAVVPAFGPGMAGVQVHRSFW